MVMFIFIIISFLSCKDNITGNGDPSTSTISGKIDNWYYGSDKKIILETMAMDTIAKVEYLDTALISQDGSFTLNFKEPSQNAFGLFTLPDNCISNVQINPPGLKWLVLMLSVYSDTAYFGSVFYVSDTVLYWHEGQKLLYPAYFNNAGSIMGRDSCYSGGISHVLKFNLSFTANKLTNVTAIYHQYSNEEDQIFYTTDPYTLKWYFIPNYSGENFIKDFK